MDIPKPVPACVTAGLLRALFREMRIFEKVGEGYFTRRLYWQGKGLPVHLGMGSTSLIWEFLTPEGKAFARVHEYRDALGKTVGLPDPKRLLMGEVSLFVSSA